MPSSLPELVELPVHRVHDDARGGRPCRSRWRSARGSGRASGSAFVSSLRVSGQFSIGALSGTRVRPGVGLVRVVEELHRDPLLVRRHDDEAHVEVVARAFLSAPDRRDHRRRVRVRPAWRERPGSTRCREGRPAARPGSRRPPGVSNVTGVVIFGIWRAHRQREGEQRSPPHHEKSGRRGAAGARSACRPPSFLVERRRRRRPSRTASQERESVPSSPAWTAGAPDGCAGREAGRDLDLVGGARLEAGQQQRASSSRRAAWPRLPTAGVAKRTTASPSIAAPARPFPSIAATRRAGVASAVADLEDVQEDVVLRRRLRRDLHRARRPGRRRGGSRARAGRSRPRTSSTSSAGTGRRAAGRPPAGRAASSAPIPRRPPRSSPGVQNSKPGPPRTITSRSRGSREWTRSRPWPSSNVTSEASR